MKKKVNGNVVLKYIVALLEISLPHTISCLNGLLGEEFWDESSVMSRCEEYLRGPSVQMMTVMITQMVQVLLHAGKCINN